MPSRIGGTEAAARIGNFGERSRSLVRDRRLILTSWAATCATSRCSRIRTLPTPTTSSGRSRTGSRSSSSRFCRSSRYVRAEAPWRGLLAHLVRISQTLSKDTLPFVRTQTLSIVFQLLKEKPEQEQNLLRLLVNKLVSPPPYRPLIPDAS